MGSHTNASMPCSFKRSLSRADDCSGTCKCVGKGRMTLVLAPDRFLWSRMNLENNRRDWNRYMGGSRRRQKRRMSD
ncbi:hypothetical protein M404DRAFT_483374 [Pisolithus tinctorius Marx 270]|uniref:Uncharacterized protein n=1 Tax=Pisolithus tinctorius Marx 270 TaxID=870435 RepID=A0A0C3KA19_PISTI|nr:hypothetical protein M404DRAFT_483374 [Pisolithus tinctorius Marx 270]